mmetsp:Transcript_14060/g.39782  ORF Transcript_14060/g.39782 Transcript_14060/m.39782 type:complete len:92 (+) Transcript_14060:780-1055(+)
MRVLKPTIEKWPVWLDIYPNLEFVQKIKAPTLIMHGTADEVIHISNATLLHSLCGNSVSPLWVEGYDHQNLDFSPQYVERLGHFMQEISMS